MNNVDRFAFIVSLGLFGGIALYLVSPGVPQTYKTRSFQIGGAAAISCVLMFMGNYLAPIPVANSERIVLLLDSPLRKNVYEQGTFDRGGTNADDLKAMLAGEPNLLVFDERISPGWREEAKITLLGPRLIVIHPSVA